MFSALLHLCPLDARVIPTQQWQPQMPLDMTSVPWVSCRVKRKITSGWIASLKSWVIRTWSCRTQMFCSETAELPDLCPSSSLTHTPVRWGGDSWLGVSSRSCLPSPWKGGKFSPYSCPRFLLSPALTHIYLCWIRGSRNFWGFYLLIYLCTCKANWEGFSLFAWKIYTADLIILLLKGVDPKDGIPYEKKFCKGKN